MGDPGLGGAAVSRADRYGDELLAAIAQAITTPTPEGPRRERSARARPDPETEQRFERLKVMRNNRARELGLEPGVLCANAALLVLAGTPRDGVEDGPEMRSWQRAAEVRSRRR